VVSHGDKALATVYLGSAPGGRKANARTADDRVVYNVDLATYDLPNTSADWLDKALLQRDASLLTRIEVAEAGKPVVTLHRPAPPSSKEAAENDGGGGDKKGEAKAEAKGETSAGAQGEAKSDAKGEAKSASDSAAQRAWSADGLNGSERLDPAKADALARTIANLRIDNVLGTQPQPDWQQEPPQLRLTLTDANDKSVTWTIVKPKTGDSHVLKASDKPWYFELKSWDAQPLLDAAAHDKLVTLASAASPPAAPKAVKAALPAKPSPPAKSH
jgi:hypothetical protein